MLASIKLEKQEARLGRMQIKVKNFHIIAVDREYKDSALQKLYYQY